MTQLLLYGEIPVADQLHSIRLVNPLFSFSGSTPGDWQARSTEWSWTGGSGTATFVDDGFHHYPIKQGFPNPLLDDTYYNVSIEITGLSHGGVRVFIGPTAIAQIQSNGVHTISYFSFSGNTAAASISLFPTNLGGWFNGGISSVSIVQDPVLSPPKQVKQFEPVGMLDVDDGERIGLSFQMSDLKQISTRFAGYSKVFKLPATPNNAKLLGHLHVNESTPGVFDPLNRSRVVLLADDVPVLRGWMSLKSTTTEEARSFYEVELFDDGLSLTEFVRGKKLSDLDLSRFAHTLNRDTIVSTWIDDWEWSRGYHYPLYLNVQDRFSVSDDFRPAWSCRAIVDQIFREAGMTYDVSSEMEGQLNKLLHAPIGKKPQAVETELISNGALVASDQDQTWFTAGVVNTNGDPWPGRYAVDQWQTNIEISDPSERFDNSANRWNYITPFDGTYTLSLTANTVIDFVGATSPGVTFDQTFNGSSGIRFEVYDWDSSVNIAVTNEYFFPAQFTDPLHFNCMFSCSTDVQLIAGQRIGVRGHIVDEAVYHAQITDFPRVDVFFGPEISMAIADESSFFDVQLKDGEFSTSEGMLVDPKLWIGTQSQQQFIDDVLVKAFNGYMVPDRLRDNHVHIRSYSELYDTDKIIDRSGRIDLSEEIKRERLSEVGSAKVSFGYREPKDEFNQHYFKLAGEQYGDEQFDYGSNLRKDTTDIRFSTWSPTPITRDNGGRYVPAVLSRATDQDAKLLIRSNETYPSEVKVSWFSTLTNEHTTNVYNYYRPCLHVDSLTASTFDVNFGSVDLLLTDVPLAITANNIFNANYRNQLSNQKDAVLYTVMMRLNNSEVVEHLDNPGARIFVDELNTWCILHSIEDWDPTRSDQLLTKVSLLSCGPSNKRIRQTYASTPPKTIQGINSLTTGDVGGGHVIEQATGVHTTISNANNGFNNIATNTNFNHVGGSGNEIRSESNNNTVFGSNNVIGFGVSGTTILGGSGIIANNSNTVFLANSGVISESGSTFYGSSGVTITPTYTSLYNSAVTIGQYNTTFYGNTRIDASGVTIGEVVINSSGITIGGISLSAATDFQTRINSVGMDLAWGNGLGTGTTGYFRLFDHEFNPDGPTYSGTGRAYALRFRLSDAEWLMANDGKIIIERWRQKGRKGLDIHGIPEFRLAGYRRALSGGTEDRPTEIPITASTMLSHFGQENYFRLNHLFPQPHGMKRNYSLRRFESDNIGGIGWVDLRFRVEVTIDGRKYLSKGGERIRMQASLLTYQAASGFCLSAISYKQNGGR